ICIKIDAPCGIQITTCCHSACDAGGNVNLFDRTIIVGNEQLLRSRVDCYPIEAVPRPYQINHCYLGSRCRVNGNNPPAIVQHIDHAVSGNYTRCAAVGIYEGHIEVTDQHGWVSRVESCEKVNA